MPYVSSIIDDTSIADPTWEQVEQAIRALDANLRAAREYYASGGTDQDAGAGAERARVRAAKKTLGVSTPVRA
jgi:hypothetical protein